MSYQATKMTIKGILNTKGAPQTDGKDCKGFYSGEQVHP